MTMQTIQFQPGSVRSLALKLKSFLDDRGIEGDTTKLAWDFAKNQKGKKILEDVEAMNEAIVQRFIKEDEPVKNEPTMISEEHMKSVVNTTDPINSKVRKLFLLGYSKRDIAHAVVPESKFKHQRISIPIKNMKAKIVADLGKGIAVADIANHYSCTKDQLLSVIERFSLTVK